MVVGVSALELGRSLRAGTNGRVSCTPAGIARVSLGFSLFALQALASTIPLTSTGQLGSLVVDQGVVLFNTDTGIYDINGIPQNANSPARYVVLPQNFGGITQPAGFRPVFDFTNIFLGSSTAVQVAGDLPLTLLAGGSADLQGTFLLNGSAGQDGGAGAGGGGGGGGGSLSVFASGSLAFSGLIEANGGNAGISDQTGGNVQGGRGGLGTAGGGNGGDGGSSVAGGLGGAGGSANLWGFFDFGGGKDLSGAATVVVEAAVARTEALVSSIQRHVDNMWALGRGVHPGPPLRPANEKEAGETGAPQTDRIRRAAAVSRRGSGAKLV